MYCLFSREIYKYDPSGKQTAVTASQTSPGVSGATAACSSLLLQRGWKKKSQPGRCAQAALDAEEGGREEREEREGGEEKKTQRDFFFFFFTCDKSCSHMGGTRPSDLTKGWIGWSQWSIGWGGVLPGGRRAAGGGQPQSMGLWADCDGISSTALYNGFLGVAALSPQHLQPFDFPAQWSVNTRTELHLHVQCMHPSSACAPWHISDVI